MHRSARLLLCALTLALCGPLARAEADWHERLIGSWSISPAGSEQVFAVMLFAEDGTVTNTVTDAFGHYYLIPPNRLLLEFSDSLILGEVKEADGILMLSGIVSGVQPVNLVFSATTEASVAAAETQHRQVVAMQKQQLATAIRQAIMNNLRQFAAAAQQYMLDQGVDAVGYEDIVGPGKLLESLRVINGEDYSTLSLSFASTEVSIVDADGTEVTYEY